MAIEVVGYDETKKRKATCQNCGAKLEFFPVEIKDRTTYSFGDFDVFRFVECPSCGICVEVKE